MIQQETRLKVADNFAHASFSKISFFHDIFLLITQLRLPSGQ